MKSPYRFQTLDLYAQALDYVDAVADLTEKLQAKRTSPVATRLMDSATHIMVQIAGRSSGDSEIERSFMVDGTLMSLYETVACLDIIRKRKLLPATTLQPAEDLGQQLHENLQKMKKALKRH